MKRPRKRFATEEAIVKAIDALQAKIFLECREAEELDAEADRLYREIGNVTDPDALKGQELADYHKNRMVAKESRTRAELLRRVQGRRSKQMARLKAAWGEFKTAPMAFLSDESVVLEKP